MTEELRLATPEEVTQISQKADLTPTSKVFAEGQNLAVVRMCYELDPVYFHEDSPPSARYLFLRDITNVLRGGGITELYFNVLTEDEQFQAFLYKNKAEKISAGPEFRFKKLL